MIVAGGVFAAEVVTAVAFLVGKKLKVAPFYLRITARVS
jgi:hypothetical protein